MTVQYHPQLRELAADLTALLEHAPALSMESLHMMREGTAALVPEFAEDIPVHECHIPGAPGQPEVKIFVINEQAGASRPAILHMHGGGFVLGTAKGSVADLQALCRELNCVAVTVDYRLAPEATLAESLEDNYAALGWLHEHADELGVDNRRIAVMGESAGGGHAAMLALTARDRNDYPIAFQCLLYPMLDDRTGSVHYPPLEYASDLLWNAASNQFGWRSLLGAGHYECVPARSENLAGLPPAFIGVGSLDLLCDESISYAQRLIRAGITTELVVVPGAYHGFDNVPIPGIKPTPVGEAFRQHQLQALAAGYALPL